MSTTRRQVKLPGRSLDKKAAAIAEAKAILQSIEDKDRQIALLNTGRQTNMEKLEALMVANSLPEVDDGVYQATYKETQGRVSPSLDIKKFYKKVGLQTFLQVASVTQNEAKKHLTELELEAMLNRKEGETKPATLVVKPVKKGK